jgi:hypothetical protein
MENCSQCGKPAMYKVEGGHLLCLDCFYKYESIKRQDLADLLALKNFYIDQIEVTTGLHGHFPRHQIPQPSPIVNRNINISNSTVGAVNTGYIDNMNVNLKHIADNGNEDLAKLLIQFAEELMKIDISVDSKNEVLEQIDFLSNQLAGQEPPKKSMTKSVLKSIPLLISSSESLLNIWNNISEKISGLIS